MPSTTGEGCGLQVPRLGQAGRSPQAIWTFDDCRAAAPFLCERHPWVKRPETGHLYRSVWYAPSWSAAVEVCRGLGAHLVTISDATEAAFVESHFQGTSWIGATDGHQEGRFTWVTAEPFTYQDWAPGEPDESHGEDDCAALDLDNRWHDRALRDQLSRHLRAGVIGAWHRPTWWKHLTGCLDEPTAGLPGRG